MSNKDSILENVREFVLRQFPLAKRRDIQNEDSLLDQGIIDSLGILDVVAHLETTFAIQVSDDEMLSEHFESIASIADFVHEKKGQGERAAWTT